MAEVNDSLLSKLRTTKNLEKFFGKKIARQLVLENSACCGLGRKRVNFVDANGLPKLLEYPVTFNNVEYADANAFLTALNVFYGVGYVAYIADRGHIMVLGAPHKKTADGTLNIANTIVI